MALPVKVLVVAVAALVVALAVYGVYMLVALPGNATSPVPSSFTVDGRTYHFTYTATTEAEREAGLMNKEVTNATTMLFAFPSFGQWSFYMYDTNTSLDMIWLNATGTSARVVYVAAGVPPCFDSASSDCPNYTPTAQANYVIEAKAGFAAANGITMGTSIQFD